MAVTELAAVVGAPAPRAPVTRAGAGAGTDGRDPDEVPTSRLRHLYRPIAFRRGAIAETARVVAAPAPGGAVAVAAQA